MSEAARFALPGTPHKTLPAGLPSYFVGCDVLPWLCPVCDQVVAETAMIMPDPATVPTGYSPTRQPDGDEDGVPFFGPSRRRMRDKSERRKPERLRNVQRSRQTDMDHADHEPIRAPIFDVVCMNCPTRLRIRLY